MILPEQKDFCQNIKWDWIHNTSQMPLEKTTKRSETANYWQLKPLSPASTNNQTCWKWKPENTKELHHSWNCETGMWKGWDGWCLAYVFMCVFCPCSFEVFSRLNWSVWSIVQYVVRPSGGAAAGGPGSPPFNFTAVCLVVLHTCLQWVLRASPVAGCGPETLRISAGANPLEDITSPVHFNYF